MTDAEWFASNNPEVLLNAVRPRATDRQLRLFAVACCRADPFWPRFRHRKSLAAVRVAEMYADGLACKNEMLAVNFVDNGSSTWAMQQMAMGCCWPDPYYASRIVIEYATCSHDEDHSRAAQQRCSNLLRCIFAPPSAAASQEHWCPPAAVRDMARSIYQSREWDALPMLGDAAEAAGSLNHAALDHLRGPGPHTRGCWALDLLKGGDR